MAQPTSRDPSPPAPPPDSSAEPAPSDALSQADLDALVEQFAPDEAPAPSDAWLTRQALAAAVEAVEATAERLLAERTAALQRFATLEQRLCDLEQRPVGAGPAPLNPVGRADFDAAIGALEDRLAQLNTGLEVGDQHRALQKGRADALATKVQQIEQMFAERLADGALEARLAALADARPALEVPAVDPARDARLDTLTARLEALASALAELERAQPAPDTSLVARIAALEAALEPKGATAAETAALGASATPVDAAVSAAALDELAARLADADAFREAAWAARLRFVDDPCALAGWLVADYLAPNTPLPVLRAVDGWLAAQFAGQVRLILPDQGTPFDFATHERIQTVTAAGGMLRAVVKLVRPGLRCDDEVRRKAEVVAS